MGPSHSILVALLFCGSVAAEQKQQGSSREPVELRVPFAEGETQPVYRGPGVLSHTGRFNRHAVDFSPIAEGHLIVAATAGEVVFVKEDTEGPTGNVADNNEVAIRIPGTKRHVIYLHLQKDGALVEVGDFVLPGDPIGRVGNTGSSEATHLHIDVRIGHRLGPSIPWRFREFDQDRVLRAGDRLTSQNVSLRPVLGPWIALERHCRLAAELGRPETVASRVRELRALVHADSWPDALAVLNDHREAAAMLEDLHGRVEDVWADIAVQMQNDFARERVATDRAALALRLVALFPERSESASAKCFLLEARADLKEDARRSLRWQDRSLAALERAFAIEAQVLGSVVPRQIDPSHGRRVQAAFDQARETLPSTMESRLRDYASRTSPVLAIAER